MCYLVRYIISNITDFVNLLSGLYFFVVVFFGLQLYTWKFNFGTSALHLAILFCLFTLVSQVFLVLGLLHLLLKQNTL